MARGRAVRRDEAAEVLAEARRILRDKETAALADGATLRALEQVVADDFDPTFTAERAAALLAPGAWRMIRNRMAKRRSNEQPAEDGCAPLPLRLPVDLAQSLAAIAPSPVEAIRKLLAEAAAAAPQPGSDEYCRRHLCQPRVPLGEAGRWSCDTCGLVGRVAWPINGHMAGMVEMSARRAASLRDAAADLYEAFPTGQRFTVVSWAAEEADLPRRERLQARADRAATLAELADQGLLEEAPGPRGGLGYRTLEEPPDWLAELLADRRAGREADEAARKAHAEAIQRALEEGLSYSTEGGTVVRIEQSEHGLELLFPGPPAWEIRETMKVDGDCRWDPGRRRWYRTRPVASVEAWLAQAIEAGGLVLPRSP